MALPPPLANQETLRYAESDPPRLTKRRPRVIKPKPQSLDGFLRTQDRLAHFGGPLYNEKSPHWSTTWYRAFGFPHTMCDFLFGSVPLFMADKQGFNRRLQELYVKHDTERPEYQGSQHRLLPGVKPFALGLFDPHIRHRESRVLLYAANGHAPALTDVQLRTIDGIAAIHLNGGDFVVLTKEQIAAGIWMSQELREIRVQARVAIHVRRLFWAFLAKHTDMDAWYCAVEQVNEALKFTANVADWSKHS